MAEVNPVQPRELEGYRYELECKADYSRKLGKLGYSRQSLGAPRTKTFRVGDVFINGAKPYEALMEKCAQLARNNTAGWARLKEVSYIKGSFIKIVPKAD